VTCEDLELETLSDLWLSLRRACKVFVGGASESTRFVCVDLSRCWFGLLAALESYCSFQRIRAGKFNEAACRARQPCHLEGANAVRRAVIRIASRVEVIKVRAVKCRGRWRQKLWGAKFTQLRACGASLLLERQLWRQGDGSDALLFFGNSGLKGPGVHLGPFHSHYRIRGAVPSG
jgi:hypothetical protein